MHVRARRVRTEASVGCARLVHECFHGLGTALRFIFFVEVHLSEAIADDLEMQRRRVKFTVGTKDCENR